MRMKIDVSGLSELTRQLVQLGEDAERVTVDVITDVVLDTQQYAVDGIQRGPATGRVYEKYNPRRTHQASAPGEYPMTDTGRLASSVVAFPPTEGNVTGTVGTNIEYGRHLEFGTSRMAARPWLMPSFERATQGIEQELRKRLEAKL